MSAPFGNSNQRILILSTSAHYTKKFRKFRTHTQFPLAKFKWYCEHVHIWGAKFTAFHVALRHLIGASLSDVTALRTCVIV